MVSGVCLQVVCELVTESPLLLQVSSRHLPHATSAQCGAQCPPPTEQLSSVVVCEPLQPVPEGLQGRASVVQGYAPLRMSTDRKLPIGRQNLTCQSTRLVAQQCYQSVSSICPPERSTHLTCPPTQLQPSTLVLQSLHELSFPTKEKVPQLLGSCRQPYCNH